MDPIHFHFQSDIHAAQIQLFVKVVKAIIEERFSDIDERVLTIEYPQEIKDLSQLKNLCKQGLCENGFSISTPVYTGLKYCFNHETIISDLSTNTQLSLLQDMFWDFRQANLRCLPHNAMDDLLSSFIIISNSLTLFFLKRAQEDDCFCWDVNYGPCFFDRKNFSFLRGEICLLTLRQTSMRGDTECFDTARCMMMSFMYQCGYLGFWCCLVDVMFFPGNSRQEKEVLMNLATFLLSNYQNIYLYNLVIESDEVENRTKIGLRGSSDNTTRIKLYFTKEDGLPILIRLDLPHKGFPYVHLNIQEGEVNRHVPLSKECMGTEYDHVFSKLEKALMQYDFNAAEYYHSHEGKDIKIIKDMCYRTALFNYSHSSFSYLIMGEESSTEKHPIVKHSKELLIDLLQSDGFTMEDLLELNPTDLLECAYSSLVR